MARLEDDPEGQLQLAGEEFANVGESSIGDHCDECDFTYVLREDIYTHGYRHFGVPGLAALIDHHKGHILEDFEVNELCPGGRLNSTDCPSFNVPLQPGVPLTEQIIGKKLLQIRRSLGQTFKCRVGVSRVLQHKSSVPEPELKFYWTTHDELAESEPEPGNQPEAPQGGAEGAGGGSGGTERQMVRVNATVVDTELISPLHPYSVTDLASIYRAAPKMMDDIRGNMLNDRPNSEWRLVTPTNLCFYCYVPDSAASLPITINSTDPHFREIVNMYLATGATEFTLKVKVKADIEYE